MKRGIVNLIGVFLLFAVPVSIISRFLDFDKASAVVFIILASILLFINRKKIDLQKLAFPFFYILLIRTKAGLKFMDRLAEKHRELIKLLGLCAIGIGFIGMIIISINFIIMLFNIIKQPIEASQGVALVLPLTNVPGVGYLSFWHFIIGIFFIAAIHEFAHGVVARAHNLNVKSSGVGFLAVLLPIFPLAFVEPDEKRLKKEKGHVQYSVFAAGPSINLIVAFIILLLMPYVANPLAYAPFEEKLTQPLGVSFSAIQEGFPAEESGLQAGVVINNVDGKEVKDYADFLRYMQTVRPSQQLIFESDEQKYVITTTNNPDGETIGGYIGVMGINNEREVKSEYQNIKSPFYWLKGLFRWLFILNFAIGLINLLPIYITDGGRMLGIALLSIVKDKKKAAKIYAIIAMLFLAALLIPLIINYGSKLMGLIP